MHSWFAQTSVAQQKLKEPSIEKPEEQTSGPKAVTAEPVKSAKEEKGKFTSTLGEMMAATEQLTQLQHAMAQMQTKLQGASNSTRKLLDSLRHVEDVAETLDYLRKKLASAQTQVALVMDGTTSGPSPENLTEVMQNAQALVSSIEKAFG